MGLCLQIRTFRILACMNTGMEQPFSKVQMGNALARFLRVGSAREVASSAADMINRGFQVGLKRLLTLGVAVSLAGCNDIALLDPKGPIGAS